MDDKIAKTFGLNIKDVTEQTSRLITTSINGPIDNRQAVLSDFEKARTNLLEIIAIGQEAIAEFSLICSQAQNDKYYMALSSMMKTVSDSNKQLLELQEKIREIENLAKNEPKHVTNQVIMTTADFQKYLKKGRE
jgi:hypothetical protein